MRGSGDGAERVISDFKVAITIDTGCSHFHQFLGHLERIPSSPGKNPFS